MELVETYDLIIEPWRGGFATTQRPFPEKMRYIPYIEEGKYDFAILHLDQQSIYEPSREDNISKGRLFLEARELIGDLMPVVIVNHMTPYHDKYENAYVVKKIKQLVGSDTMICNSYEAAQQWGFGRVITHGMAVDEWGFDVERYNRTGEKIEPPKEPRCIIVLSPAGMEKAYRRIFANTVVRKLEDKDVPIEWVGVTKKFNTFDDYRDYLARSLVFFNPTWQSPRPRARTEAMLSGCCVVTTPYHDATTFIEDGVNGFLTSKEEIKDPRVMDNPDKAADLIESLIRDRADEAIEIGKKGRETAMKLFNKDVFEDQWRKLIEDIL